MVCENNNKVNVDITFEVDNYKSYNNIMTKR